MLALACGAGIFTHASPVLAQAAGTGTIHGTLDARPVAARASAVVYLETVPGTFRPPAQHARIDQRGLQFLPHVLAILRGTTVDFLNSDNVRHNVFSPDGVAYNLGSWPQGETRSQSFAQPGVFRQLCQIHPEMQSFILVLSNPFFAVTDAEGAFRIADVPPGTYTLKVWSERLPLVTQQVTVTAGGDLEVHPVLRRQ
ncbi:MAG: carboxypeptidase regulatory-like domain-containing protein [Deltaproteobacteria bacterium]